MFIINYFKNDFAKVYTAMQFLTNGKMPMWLAIVVYILLLPVGLALMPFAIVWMLYVKWQLRNMDK